MWMFAAAPAVVLFVLEAFKLGFYEAVRAPNAPWGFQLAAMGAFFALWTLAPRAAWSVRKRQHSASGWKSLLVKLAAAGAILSSIHLLLLSLILRLLYSPPGWGAGHLLHSFGEVWLSYASLWFSIYAIACGAIIYATRAGVAPVRDAGVLIAPHNGAARILRPDNILWVEACGNYVEIHTDDGAVTLRRTIASSAANLGPGFVRAHRSAIVNASAVTSIRAIDNTAAAYGAVLRNGAVAPLSRRRLAAVKAALVPRTEG